MAIAKRCMRRRWVKKWRYPEALGIRVVAYDKLEPHQPRDFRKCCRASRASARGSYLGRPICIDLRCSTAPLEFLSATTRARIVSSYFFCNKRLRWIQCFFQVRKIFWFIHFNSNDVIPSVIRACFCDIPNTFFGMNPNNYRPFLGS